MDRPYSTIRRQLRSHERLLAFAAAQPTPARVSEPTLPLVLAALHEDLARPSSASSRGRRRPRCGRGDRLAARAENVAFFPSRGVGWGSGLEPPPHLVGERARALDVLAAGGIVCASAAALAEGMPSVDRVPKRSARRREEPGIEGLAESLALAGYERASGSRNAANSRSAAESSTSSLRPGGSRSGSSSSATRSRRPRVLAVHAARAPVRRKAGVYPAAERRIDLVEPVRDDDGPPPACRLVPALLGIPDLVWEPDEVERVWSEELDRSLSFAGATELGPLPPGQPFSFEAQRPASPPAACPKPRTSSLRSSGRAARGRRVPAPGGGAPDPEHVAACRCARPRRPRSRCRATRG